MARRRDGRSPRSFGARSLVVVALAAAGCSRTPPEPTPAATVQADPAPRTTTASARAEPAAAARCIAALPASSPKIPPPADAAQCPPDPEPESKMPTAEVTFPDAPGAPRVEVELAKTPHDVERGLMYRRAMADDHGMLFRLDGRREHTFWMRNTCIPLDMMFVDDDGVIVGIVEGAAPLTETTRSVGCPSVFVLEVNGGWARKRGVVPGQKITIPFAAR
ncbi:MAG: DUF192 domain-containing protein [Labilithrix sp.]|nr:DUF192 domain-containing protein [Labilithrix sp.]